MCIKREDLWKCEGEEVSVIERRVIKGTLIHIGEDHIVLNKKYLKVNERIPISMIKSIKKMKK